MKLSPALAVATALMLPSVANAEITHIPVGARPSGAAIPAGLAPPFSAAVVAGETLYLSGTTDGTDPATGKLAVDAKTGAKVVLDNIKATLEAAGLTMDDLVWVQIFTSDLKTYADFNTVYRGYFKGPMPARAFIGAGALLGGAHFEVMGVAVRPAK